MGTLPEQVRSNAEAKLFRRIVTGHDSAGKSVCLSDSEISESDGWLYDLWQTQVPADITEAAPQQHFPLRLAPPVGSLTFRIMKVPPKDVVDRLTKEEIDRTLLQLGAAGAGVQAEHALMHKTLTLDLLVVLSGRVTLHLEDGDLHLEPFDSVVQRGTAHAWSTPDDQAANVLVVLVDAAQR